MKRAILFNVPVSVCNMRCHYCYIGQRPEGYTGLIPEMRFSPSEIGYAMRPERLGGTSFFNITAGGETLLVPQLRDYAKAIVDEGHYLEIVSNMTLSKQLSEVLSIGREALSHIEFKCSFHYLELERKGLLECFAENVNRAWDSGASISIETTANDELIPHIDEVKAFSLEHFGALPHVTIARDDNTYGIDRLTMLDLDTYNKTWSQFDSPFFDFKTSIFGRKQKDFCYAGLWSCHANLSTGEARQCVCGSVIGNLFENPDDPINWNPIGKCQLPHCYNGHAFLTLGTIPGFTDMTYSDMRDRVRKDGSHWLHDDLRAFYGGKLEACNDELEKKVKLQAAIKAIPGREVAKAKRVRKTIIRNR